MKILNTLTLSLGTYHLSSSLNFAFIHTLSDTAFGCTIFMRYHLISLANDNCPNDSTKYANYQWYNYKLFCTAVKIINNVHKNQDCKYCNQ